MAEIPAEAVQAAPLVCPRCKSQAAVVEYVLGVLDWGPAVVSGGVVHPATRTEPPVVMSDNSSTAGTWGACTAPPCGHRWRLRQRFDPARQIGQAP